MTDLLQNFLQNGLNGMALGSVLALAAAGLTLTYGILRLANFAHGDLMTIGAYLTWVGNRQGLNLGVAMGLGALGTMGVALLTEALLWAPLRSRRASPTTLMIISIGLALFLRNGLILIWGPGNQDYDLPVSTALNWFGLRLTVSRVVVIGLAIAIITALHYLLQHTKMGKAMRAVADDLELARVAGINVEQVVIWTWLLAAGLTALGGGMLGLITTIRPNMGWFLVLPVFASVILGGIGNPYGAIAGAFIIGITQEIGAMVPWIGSEYKVGVAFVIMISVLLLRPQGLFRGTL